MPLWRECHGCCCSSLHKAHTKYHLIPYCMCLCIRNIYFSEAIFCGSSRATRPQQRAQNCLPISFSGSEVPIVPDFLPTVKEPSRTYHTIVSYLKQWRTWVQRLWRNGKIHERIAWEEGQMYWEQNTDGKLRQGTVLANALSTLPYERWMRWYKVKRKD